MKNLLPRKSNPIVAMSPYVHADAPIPMKLFPVSRFTITHSNPHAAETTTQSRRKEAVFHSRSIALPTKSTIKPLKTRFIGSPLANGYVTNCHILPCRTLCALNAKNLVLKPGANIDNSIPAISKIIMAVTPGVKSFAGEGKDICVCWVVYMATFSDIDSDKHGYIKNLRPCLIIIS